MPTSNRTHAAVVVAMIIGPVVLGSADVGQAAETLDIVYLANEGFLLRSGETAVLIDAVFGDGLFGYGILDASERQKLETAQPPYDSVDLVLASHSHGDHFNVPAMARFLAANPKTKLISTEHAVDKLLTYNADPVDRVLGVFPTEGQQVSVSQDGIDLTVFNLHHGRGSQTQNLGLLVEICGLTILHIGDTETSPEEMRVAGLEDLAPDVALLPSWYLRPGRWTAAIEQIIRPRRLVAMHLPTDEAPESYFWGGLNSPQKIVGAIEADFPGTFVPLTTGESISLTCRGTD